MTAVAAWTTRDVVVVEGPDAQTYLQGQVSQDLGDLQIGEITWTFVLEPTGKVDAWGRVRRTGDDAYRFDVDPGAGEALLARLQRFLMRTKATISLTVDVPTISVRGILPDGADGGWSDATWGGVPGADLLEATESVTPTDGVRLVDGTALESWRIEAGRPAWGHEILPGTIPAALGPEVMARSVSFTKGCYTGQELVARMDARVAAVPHRVARLVLPGASATPVEGAPITRAGEVVGEITSAAPRPDAVVALARVPRSAVLPLEVEVDGAAGRLVELVDD